MKHLLLRPRLDGHRNGRSTLIGLCCALLAQFLLNFTPATAATVALPKVLPCFGAAIVKPSSYVIACADANTYLKKVHWSSWTASKAEGTAVFWMNDCTPYCAAGKFHSYSSSIRLSAPKSTTSGRLFSLLTVVYRVGASKNVTLSQSLPLKPLRS